MLLSAVCLTPGARAQSESQQPSGQSAKPGTPGGQENPFPEDPAKAQAPDTQPGQAKPSDAKPSETKPSETKPGGAKPDGSSDNPFPGETSDAPIIPVDPGTTSGSGSDSGSTRNGSASDADPRRGADPDGDPMRSPDPAGNTTDDRFASSRSGLRQIPAEDDNDGRPGKSSRNKTRQQVIKEDLDVGRYYLDRKNWKGAQARFASAFSLDGENPDAVWGLAEAERHLELFKDAADHYKLFLSYDPDGPHSKPARKALEEIELARPAVAAGTKSGITEKNVPR
jgi:hypothetical protein